MKPQGQQFRTQGSRSKTLDSTPAHAHATDNNEGRGSGANHGAQLQAAALQTREQLGQLETQLKQASGSHCRAPHALLRVFGWAS